MNAVIALCNSCLRVRFFDTDEQAHESDCVCGATGMHQDADAYCSCPSCHADAQLLIAGQRTGIPGIPERVNLDGWTADGGVPA